MQIKWTLLLCLAPLAVVSGYAQTPAATSAPAAKPHSRAAAQHDPGERAFQANCSRCHSAPEQLTPHVSSPIVQHMRVRANLSAKDQELILKFLAP